MINDIELIAHPRWLNERKVVIYGAGQTGERVYAKLDKAGITNIVFADSSSSKWGETCMGVAIISPVCLAKLDRAQDIAVIIASIHIADIDQMLENKKIAQGRCYTEYALNYALHFGLMGNQIAAPYSEIYQTIFRHWQMGYSKKRDYRCLTFGFGSITPKQMYDFLVNDAFLIYQPGKVGSSTIYKSLSQYKNLDVCHLHDISYVLEEHMDKTEREKVKKAIKNKKNIKIFSLVRDPVARDLSYFMFCTYFHFLGLIKDELSSNFEESFRCYIDKYTNNLTTIGNNTRAYTWLDYIGEHFKFGGEFDWFDVEIKEIFDIDVFQFPFDRKKGYVIIKKGNVELMICQMEKINNLVPQIGNFFGLNNFELENDNESKNYLYRFAYQELKQQFLFPKNYLDFYYKDNLRMKHFYSEKDIDKFKEKRDYREI